MSDRLIESATTAEPMLDRIRKALTEFVDARSGSQAERSAAYIVAGHAGYLMARLAAAERYIEGTPAFNKAVAEADYETARAEREKALKDWEAAKGAP